MTALDVIERPSLYEEDYVAWAEAQAARLRRGAAGAAGLDFVNLAEEVEDLAKSVERACRSQIANIVRHFLKLQFSPATEARRHWRGEIVGFRNELEAELTPTLRRRMPSRLRPIIDGELRRLSVGGEIVVNDEVRSAAHRDYSWTHVTSSDWFPEA